MKVARGSRVARWPATTRTSPAARNTRGGREDPRVPYSMSAIHRRLGGVLIERYTDEGLLRTERLARRGCAFFMTTVPLLRRCLVVIAALKVAFRL